MKHPHDVLSALRQKASLGGGEDKLAMQRKKGKLTARERLDLLFDPGTFVELGAFMEHSCQDFGMQDKKVLGDGVVTGWGCVDGRMVYAYAQDFTVFGGSLSATNAQKIVDIMKRAIKNGAPIIGLTDSGGARIHEGVASLGGFADIFYQNVQASGVIPQLSVVMGPCAGGAVYSPAITDCIFMVEDTSHMFITGPDVIKAVTSECVSFDELGGSHTHSTLSGVVDRSFSSEMEAIAGVKKWLSYVPSHNREDPLASPLSHKTAMNEKEKQDITEKLVAAEQRVAEIVPDNPNHPYDVSEVVKAVVDPDSFWELKPLFAPNIVIGFARLGGYVVGVVANNPEHMAGVLDIDASVKAARFIRFCDAFQIPLITFVDVPGFLPGKDQEKNGIIRHGAKILYAYCEATVVKLTVILRKAYGGAYDVMSSKHIGGDLNLAWPGAEIAVMGAEGACNIIFRKQILQAQDPEAMRQKMVREYSQTFSNPYQAAKRGFIDAVIYPQETRRYLLEGLMACRKKRVSKPQRKHGNIPL
ncbi:MAG: acyl-CoA carboxylase subunit beta [Proteobacteria bacterium]|nr:acyl-CoA carboxylase subunit beta [Pseudomonadota bacterium]